MLTGFPPASSKEEILTDWYQFFKLFGLSPDFSKLKFPVPSKELQQVLVMAKGLCLSRVFEVCAKANFPIHFTITDCESSLYQNIPNNYAVRIRGLQQAVDSTDMLKNPTAPIRCMNMLERLVQGLKFFLEQGMPLDTETITCCSDKLTANCVITTEWSGQGTIVTWCTKNRAAKDSVRSRAMLTLPPSNKALMVQ